MKIILDKIDNINRATIYSGSAESKSVGRFIYQSVKEDQSIDGIDQMDFSEFIENIYSAGRDNRILIIGEKSGYES